jgi:hypothetical protein
VTRVCNKPRVGAVSGCTLPPCHGSLGGQPVTHRPTNRELPIPRHHGPKTGTRLKRGVELPVSRQTEREIARIAGRQRTMLTTAQLIACGLGEDAISYRIRTGRYTEVFRGVVSIVSGDFPPLAREQAALLVCGDGAFLSHHTAAFIRGLRTPHPYDVDVSVVARRVNSRKGIRVHQIRAIDERDVRRHERLLVSSPARALLEIAATLPRGDLREALGNSIERRLIRPRDIEDILERHPGRRGSARLASLSGGEDATVITRSRAACVLEADLRIRPAETTGQRAVRAVRAGFHLA